MRILGLFTGMDPTVGGIEASALVAWDALRSGRDAELVVYDQSRAAVPPFLRPTVTAGSKSGTAAALLGRRWPADTLVCWHLGLLKLLPFLRGFRGRVCLFLHGIEAWRRHGWPTSHLFDRVDLFLTNTDHTWERFLEFHPSAGNRPHRTTHLGLGVCLSGLPPPPAVTPAALILGRITRGSEHKGHRELIGCWPQVQARVPGAELWVAGDGNLRPTLEVLARQVGVANAVKFFGRVTQEQKADLLSGCRCLTMPSRGEGFGLVYLEAMRFGRPCLVSTHDAGREVIRPPDAGLAVDPKDPAALAAAVAELLTPGPRWDRMAGAAQDRYNNNFTSELFQHRLTEAVFGYQPICVASPG